MIIFKSLLCFYISLIHPPPKHTDTCAHIDTTSQRLNEMCITLIKWSKNENAPLWKKFELFCWNFLCGDSELMLSDSASLSLSLCIYNVYVHKYRRWEFIRCVWTCTKNDNNLVISSRLFVRHVCETRCHVSPTKSSQFTLQFIPWGVWIDTIRRCVKHKDYLLRCSEQLLWSCVRKWLVRNPEHG